MDSKSQIRITLEQILEDVKQIFLKDLNKVSSLAELNKILQAILEKNSLEEFFCNNQSDLYFFMTTFSHDCIIFILKKGCINGDGDEIALEVLMSFISIFLKYLNYSNYFLLWQNIQEIFQPNSLFYKPNISQLNFKIETMTPLQRPKVMTADEFNQKLATSLPKQDFMLDDIVDIKKTSAKDRFLNENEYLDLTLWVRGKIVDKDDKQYKIAIPGEVLLSNVNKDSINIAKEATYTTDYDWRINLQVGDLITCYDHKVYYTSTIIKRTESTNNGLTQVSYTIGYRIYIDQYSNWEEYDCYSEREMLTDVQGRKYIGFHEHNDEEIMFYSKRIQKLKYKPKRYIKEDYYIDQYIPLINQENQSKNYVIGRNHNFSFYYLKIITRVFELGGFDKILGHIKSNELNCDTFLLVLQIINIVSPLWHIDLLKQYAPQLKTILSDYLNNLSGNDLRNLKKDHVDYISSILYLYLPIENSDESVCDKYLQKLQLNLSIKMIKTTILDKRILSMKIITDILKEIKDSPDDLNEVIELINSNEIINEIYGTNSHVQLINKSKELIEFLAKYNRLSNEDFGIIWNVTQRNDYESKLAIINLFKENSLSFNHEQIKTILEFIYLTDPQNIINDEIDLVYYLSNEKTFLSGVIFLFKVFFSTSFNEKDKFSNCLMKLNDFAKFDNKCKEKILEVCFENIISCHYSVHCFKLLQVIIIKNKIFEGKEKLTADYKTNYKLYADKVKNIQDITGNTIIDEGCTNFISLLTRQDYANFLLIHDLWDETPNIENNNDLSTSLPYFLYDILVENNVSSDHFFIWLLNALNKKFIGNKDFELIFRLFATKIDHTKFTNEAFECFLNIFLDLNEITYSQKDNKITFIAIKPLETIESLRGFDILWKAIFTSINELIINKGINLLYLLYENNTTNLITKCLELLNNPKEADKSIRKLQLIIDESEKNGTAGIKPHYAILKKKIISLTINVFISINHKINLKVFQNTTIWELKKIISQQVKVSSDFLKIIISSANHEINNSENCKTLEDMKIKDNDELKLFYNTNLRLIPKADLLINNQINPQLKEIFNSWFDTYSTNDKMLNTDCANFIKAVTNSKDDVESNDSRVLAWFTQYDPKKEGFILREGFLKFFFDATMIAQKHDTIWENLNVMGIRNDLKKFEEDFFVNNQDKRAILRFKLSQDQSLIDILIKMNTVSSLTFLNYLCTNEQLYNDVFSFKNSDCLSNKNMTKLIYTLEIIQSFIEELEFKSYKGRINEYNETDSKNEPSINNKIEWIKMFIVNNGFDTIITLFDSIYNGNESNETKDQCLSLLINILRMIFKAYCNKFDISQQVNAKLKLIQSANNSMSVQEQKDNKANGSSSFENLFEELMIQKESSSQSLTLEKQKSSYDDTIINHDFYSTIFIAEVSDHIQKYLNCESIIQRILKMISKDDFNIDAYELLCNLVAFSKDDSIVLQSEFMAISIKGLQSKNLHNKVSLSLIGLSHINAHFKKFDLISHLINSIYDIIGSIEDSMNHDNYSETLYDLFSNLLEIFLENRDQLESLIKTDLISFIHLITKKVHEDINKTDDSKKLNIDIFIGYLSILSRVIQSNAEIRAYITTTFNHLINDMIQKGIFKPLSSEIANIQDDFVNPTKYILSQLSKSKSQQLNKAYYNLIKSIVTNCKESLQTLLKIQFFPLPSECQTIEDFCMSHQHLLKQENHVGLKNPRFICYMNSIIQQFFMMPTLRYAILQIDDGIPENIVYNMDDNTFHQIQLMFASLDYSDKSCYDPSCFCFSFKDYDGNPTNVSIQQDSNEFLCRFISIIEESLKGSKFKYIPDSVFKGQQCVQIECTNCHHIKNNFEDFSILSLEVKNYKNLYESLDKYCSKDTIDNFNCDECKKKVQIVKKNSIGQFPNTIIIYLQRLLYDYEIERNKKINTVFEFPKKLDLKKYSIEALSQVDNDEIYFKGDDYYEYELVGVNVHMGTADEGHFFSYINSTRSGEENTMNIDDNSWLKFNDSQVSKFNKDKLEAECFGSNIVKDNMFWDNTQSAYMLFYERKAKSPLKVVVDSKTIDTTTNEIISYTSAEKSRIQKKYDYHYNKLIDTANFDEFKKRLYEKIIFFNSDKNEYYSYLPYYGLERLIPKKYFIRISQMNSDFQSNLNANDDDFIDFFINVYQKTLKELNTFNEENISTILNTFMSLISMLLSDKAKLPYLKLAKEQIIALLRENTSPLILEVITKYYHDNLPYLFQNLINDRLIISEINLEILNEVIIRTPIESLRLKDSNELNVNHNLVHLIQLLLDIFPKVNNSFIQKIGPLGFFFRNLCINNVEMMSFLIKLNCVAKFVTFLIGIDSPYYDLTIDKTQHEDWDRNRLYIIHFEPFIDLLMYIYNHSNQGELLTNCDLEALKCEGMINYLLKNSYRLFSEYVAIFSFNNYTYTLSVCKELIACIDDCFIINELLELHKIMVAIFYIIAIEDQYQLLRMQILLGYPQVIFDDHNDPFDQVNYPLIGYHLMTETLMKAYDMRSLYDTKGTCCLIKKIFSLEEKELIGEAYLLLLKKCLKNRALYAYLSLLPGEELSNKTFIDYGYSVINSISLVKKKAEFLCIYETVMNELKNIEYDMTFMNDKCVGFVGNDLIHDIQKEVITLIAIKDNYVVLRYDYYTTILDFDDKVSFEHSRWNKNMKRTQQSKLNAMNDNKDLYTDCYVEDNDKNNENEEGTIIFTNKQRNTKDKDWIVKILPILEQGSTVVVNNKQIDQSTLSYHNIIRFVVFNKEIKECNITFSVDASSSLKLHNPSNEFIPSYAQTSYLPAFSAKTILTISKFNSKAKWSFEHDDSSSPLIMNIFEYAVLNHHDDYEKFNEGMKYIENFGYYDEDYEDDYNYL